MNNATFSIRYDATDDELVASQSKVIIVDAFIDGLTAGFICLPSPSDLLSLRDEIDKFVTAHSITRDK